MPSNKPHRLGNIDNCCTRILLHKIGLGTKSQATSAFMRPRTQTPKFAAAPSITASGGEQVPNPTLYLNRPPRKMCGPCCNHLCCLSKTLTQQKTHPSITCACKPGLTQKVSHQGLMCPPQRTALPTRQPYTIYPHANLANHPAPKDHAPSDSTNNCLLLGSFLFAIPSSPWPHHPASPCSCCPWNKCPSKSHNVGPDHANCNHQLALRKTRQPTLHLPK